MIDTSNDPKLIDSAHSGAVTREGVTIKLCIYRLEHTKWTLEVVDSEGTSAVWDVEFETDDDALAEFERTVRESGMLEFVPTASKRLN
jgi:hypothetical protein